MQVRINRAFLFCSKIHAKLICLCYNRFNKCREISKIRKDIKIYAWKRITCSNKS